MLNKFWLVSTFVIFSAWCTWCVAAVSEADKAKAQENADACAATAKDKPTATQVVEKVKKAAELLNKEGVKAYPKLQGKNSPFIFGGTYIWVHSADGTMLMHPIKPEMVGKNVLTIKDKDGKLFFKEMNEVVDKNGEGWVEYKWARPDNKGSDEKVSYVRAATIDGKPVIVGCGVYDLSLKQVKTELNNKPSMH